VDQGTLVLPHKLLTNAHEYPDIIYEYMVYVIGSAKAIRDSLKSGVSDAQIELEAKYMLKFEYELAKVYETTLIKSGIISSEALNFFLDHGSRR